MIINKLNKLENLIKKGEWQIEKNKNRLWGGADVIIAYELTEDLKEWESKNNLVIDFYGPMISNKVLVISKHAMEISVLFYTLKDIFKDYIDGPNKYYFYSRLAMRAKDYIAKSDDLEGVLLSIIDEAKSLAHVFEGRLYFAYGSNMDEKQMEYRCPTAKIIGKALLDSYKFIINSRGVASIVKSDGNFVEGILWSLFPEDEKALDRYEGVDSNFYFKEEVLVETQGSEKKYPALVYIASDNTIGKPRKGYLEKIISAAEKFSFTPEYIDELTKWML